MSANAIADHDPAQAVATACDVVAPGLTIGGWKQTRAPRMDNELVDLIKKHKIPQPDAALLQAEADRLRFDMRRGRGQRFRVGLASCGPSPQSWYASPGRKSTSSSTGRWLSVTAMTLAVSRPQSSSPISPENRPALGHTASGNCYQAAVRLDKTERNSNDDKA